MLKGDRVQIIGLLVIVSLFLVFFLLLDAARLRQGYAELRVFVCVCVPESVLGRDKSGIWQQQPRL